MQKKTTGAFIAASRKANGMTQRQLAEKLRKTMLAAAAVVLAVTLLCHAVVFSIPTERFADTFVGNHTFTDWDSFRSFMETAETENPEIVLPGQAQGMIQPNIPEYSIDTIDPYRPSIESIKAEDGSILCSFRPLNKSVATTVYAESKDRLPVTVYTHAQFNAAAEIQHNINAGFGILYIAELIGIAVIYLVKKRKLA